MRVNEATAIYTSSVVLVPYSAHHVPKYHTWMQDEDLREATASEPLSLDEEYAMQRSWRKDADKLTFIVCLPASAETAERSEIDRMIGDVNVFVAQCEDSENGNDGSEYLVGELELMIARRECQGKGFGQKILLTFLWYVLGRLEAISQEFGAAAGDGLAKSLMLKLLRVKIGKDNVRSIKLFERLGFRKAVEKPNFFGEWELRFELSGSNVDAILRVVLDEVGEPEVRPYDARAPTVRAL